MDKIIFAADIHLRDTIPLHRKDDFINAMWRKLKYLINTSNEESAPIFIAGDLGEKSNWSNKLILKAIEVLSSCDYEIYVIPGQHDLPGNTIDNIQWSSLRILQICGSIFLLINPLLNSCYPREISIHVFPYPQKIERRKREAPIAIAIAHYLTSDTKVPYKGVEDANQILDENDYNLIVIGDNHKTFQLENSGKKLISPGSMMRANIDQKDHKPCFFIYDFRDNSLEKRFYPIEENVFRKPETWLDGEVLPNVEAVESTKGYKQRCIDSTDNSEIRKILDRNIP